MFNTNLPDKCAEGHEFMCDEPPTTDMDECIYLAYPCRHAEVLESWTDDERCETYTKCGPECDCVYFVQLDYEITKHMGNDMYEEVSIEWYEDNYTYYRETLMGLADELYINGELPEIREVDFDGIQMDDSKYHVRITIDTTEWRYE